MPKWRNIEDMHLLESILKIQWFYGISPKAGKIRKNIGRENGCLHRSRRRIFVVMLGIVVGSDVTYTGRETQFGKQIS